MLDFGQRSKYSLNIILRVKLRTALPKVKFKFAAKREHLSITATVIQLLIQHFKLVFRHFMEELEM